VSPRNYILDAVTIGFAAAKGNKSAMRPFAKLLWTLFYNISNADNFLTLYKADINAICELLAVKHGDMESDLFSNSVLDAFIE